MFTLISVLDVVMKFLFLRYKFPCVTYIQIQVLCTFKYHQIQLLRLIKLGEGVYIFPLFLRKLCKFKAPRGILVKIFP